MRRFLISGFLLFLSVTTAVPTCLNIMAADNQFTPGGGSFIECLNGSFCSIACPAGVSVHADCCQGNAACWCGDNSPPVCDES